MLLRLAVASSALLAGARAEDDDYAPCLLATQNEACDNQYIPAGGGLPDPAICACVGAIDFAGCPASEISEFKSEENTLAAEASICPNGGPIPWAANNGIPNDGHTDDDVFVDDDDWTMPQYAYASGYAANSPDCYESQAQTCEDLFGGATGAPVADYCFCLGQIDWGECSLDYAQRMKTIMNKEVGVNCPNGILWAPNNGVPSAAPRCGGGVAAAATVAAVAAALL